MKQLLKRILPKSSLDLYHYIIVSLAAWWYGYPSRKLRVIGVTGTKGKSTTCFLIAKILEASGKRVALASTAVFKIGEREWLNPYKMTMLGRFVLQKFLRDTVRDGCEYAVLEVSSEGLAQNRHRGIEFDVAVFTNLSPEHIDSHGSFEKYREAKGQLFKALNFQFSIFNFQSICKAPIFKQNKAMVINLDDENAEYFLTFFATKKIGYGISLRQAQAISPLQSASEVEGYTDRILLANNIATNADGSSFTVDEVKFHLNLLGQFNVYNAIAAVAVAREEGISLEQAAQSLGKIKTVPGRVEFIDEGQPFRVIVDYAHEPLSLEEIFKAVRMLEPKRIIHVFGPTGGGRDTETRKKLGEISASSADIIFITTDDPYDDDPRELAKMPIAGAKSTGIDLEGRLFVVLDRREAIRKALNLGHEGDVVLITGKGSEQAMVVKGEKLPWDDRVVVREELLQDAKLRGSTLLTTGVAPAAEA